LAIFAEDSGAKVIQIATDCVFSGSNGSYLETDPHDATDVYGKTKSDGEIESSAVMQLRCSIIGRENKGKKSSKSSKDKEDSKSKDADKPKNKKSKDKKSS
jgi:dTDP-4-dehydrorhamnose reductase